MTNRSRLAAKVTVVATAARPTTAPASVVRTGTALRPRPGSRAMRTPVAALGERAADCSARATNEGRRASAISAVPCTPAGTEARRRAGKAARRRKTTTTANRAGAEDGQVDLHALVHLCPPGGTNRKQRRQHDRHHHRQRGAGTGDERRAAERQPHQLPARQPEGAQDGNLGRVLAELAGERLTEDQEPGQAGEGGEHHEGHGLGADRPLDAPVAIAVVGEQDVAADLLGPRSPGARRPLETRPCRRRSAAGRWRRRSSAGGPRRTPDRSPGS